MGFGGLFNKVSGSVRNAFTNIARSIESSVFGDLPGSSGPSTSFTAVNATANDPPPSSGSVQENVYFYTTTTGLKYTAANAVAGIMVHLDKSVSYALSEAIGQAGVQRFQQALKPIRRTGDLEGSFQYDIVNDGKGVIIYSDHPAAGSIQYGYKGAGSIEALTEWMQQKSEFRNLSDREQVRAAYFIMKKIKKNFPPGPDSTLRSLAPVGERRYDYITIVRDALEKDIQELLDGYVDAANSGSV